MNIRCEKCKTGFQIDDSLITKKGIKVRCAKCRHVFKVFPPENEKHVAKEILDLNQDLDVNSNNKTPDDKKPVFKITWDNNCPLYKTGDEFKLDGKIFLVPRGKAPCLILAKDVMRLLRKQKTMPDFNTTAAFNCSGCSGLIRFSYKSGDEVVTAALSEKKDGYTSAVVNLLSSFTIFKNLSKDELKNLVSFLKLDKFKEGDIIIRKGEPGRNLFIIVSGKVEVLSEDGMSIAFMGSGEVFGEMSLLSGDPVGATIKVIEDSTVLYIGSKDFKKVLNELPTLQLNFTRLLARRMAEINLARSEEFASGMTGRLSEMPPAELFQTLNVNQKTGVLTLKLIKSSAYLSFREGELISAKYQDKEGEEAFFELLKMKEGRFKFIPGLSPEEMEEPEIGDFMHLLMEGLRKIDEDDKNFLRTVIPTLTY